MIFAATEDIYWSIADKFICLMNLNFRGSKLKKASKSTLNMTYCNLELQADSRSNVITTRLRSLVDVGSQKPHSFKCMALC